MLKYRLNKIRIEEEMERRFLNLTDLARLLGWSKQLTLYAIEKGGKSFAPKIAAVLELEPESIIISVRKGGGPASKFTIPETLTEGGEDMATGKRVKPAPKKAAKPAKKVAKKK